MSAGFRLKPEEFRLIRLPVLLFGSAVCLALGMVILSFWLQGQAQQRQLQVRQKLDTVQAEAAAMQQDRQDYEHFSGPFRDLKARGIIGEEDRLQWVEVLTNIRRRYPEMRLQFRIEPQRPVDFIADIPQGMRVFASRMQLSFLAAHEGRLQMVLTTLDQDARGLHLLRQCHIQRGKLEGGQVDWVAPPLETKCLIEWLTVRQVAAAAPVEGTPAAEGVK